MEATLWVPAVLIVIGMVGIVIPVIPGLLLCLAGVFVWAFDTKSTLGWVVFGVCAALYLAGVALQYAVPGRRMREAGVRRSTLVLAVLLAVVGFFVIPVVGAAVGFVGGIYLVELGHSQGPFGRLGLDQSRPQGGLPVDGDRAARRPGHRRDLGRRRAGQPRLTPAPAVVLGQPPSCRWRSVPSTQ